MTEDEFRTLYLRMRDDVFAFAARRLGTGPAEDVVSETFEVVWRKRNVAPGSDENWPAWTVGVARNKIRQEVRRRWKHRRAEADLDDGTHHAHQRTTGADAEVVDSLVGRRVYQRLSETQRELFDLAHLRGLTTDQAASVLGITATAYTTRVSRLRASIERLYKEEGG
ncbi:RNA polymerase sigma factor [Nocardioides sp. Iso805N]|uniref:RNA polymerase sigma factor n=1 Tax=Nocardioides sp. Iso805N TaxID=1283287 RepID=UPI0003655D3A|nr:sigma-70 family RNA polymerase sigma factor [Nocardioides sp. Iso805N]